MKRFFSSQLCHALFQLCKFCGTFFVLVIDFCLQDSVPSVQKKMKGQMTQYMVAPYEKVVEAAKKGKK